MHGEENGRSRGRFECIFVLVGQECEKSIGHRWKQRQVLDIVRKLLHVHFDHQSTEGFQRSTRMLLLLSAEVALEEVQKAHFFILQLLVQKLIGIGLQKALAQPQIERDFAVVVQSTEEFREQRCIVVLAVRGHLARLPRTTFTVNAARTPATTYSAFVVGYGKSMSAEREWRKNSR